MRHLTYILTTAFIFLSTIVVAVNAIPEKVTHTQPDGTVLTLTIHGDEFLHWLETTDGFVIHPGDDGGLYYAVSDLNGNLVPGNILAHNPEQRNQNENSYINTLDKDIKFSKAQLAAAKEARAARMKSDKAGAFPTTGTNNLLMILVNFSDTSPTYTQTNFNNYMNQPGYNGIGSFKEYYYENSYGQLTMNTTVTAWVTVSNTHNYYGQNDPQGYDMYPQQLV
ncbi:MAG: peptidase M6, partial [Marinilabiliales bacterium]